jgi:hypothetical protein
LIFPVLLFTCLAAGFASACPDAKFFRGDISTPTSWEGTVRLTGPVVIQPGITVTVEPGTRVLVRPQRDPGIVVRGRLFVRGLQIKPVLFESDGGCSVGSWGGIVFERGSAGILEDVKIRCSPQGVGGDLKGVTAKNVVRESAR